MSKLLTITAVLLAIFVIPVQAGETLDYEPGLIKEALQNGDTVLVEYGAHYCSTCKAQARAINALRQDNPEYDKKITFVRVEWTEYRNHEVATERNVPRMSTILLLKGEEEINRTVAGNKNQIKELLDQGLATES